MIEQPRPDVSLCRGDTGGQRVSRVRLVSVSLCPTGRPSSPAERVKVHFFLSWKESGSQRSSLSKGTGQDHTSRPHIHSARSMQHVQCLWLQFRSQSHAVTTTTSALGKRTGLVNKRRLHEVIMSNQGGHGAASAREDRRASRRR